ncbi:MAG: NTP transferase domain-containing protein [Chloroflexi bacterium]|nr:NTP transferase domain-containing protein [Chloroflexota bacterium]
MYAVILAGGGGTRLWPLSRTARPKPFLALAGNVTLLASTVARLSPLVGPEDVYLVADARYGHLIREQLPDVPSSNLIAEPVGRNTAAAVALAALAIDRPADEVMAVLPADHLVVDEAGLRSALATASRAADGGHLVTLGIRPSGPETGYGYVVVRPDQPDRSGDVVPVERFVEKPDHSRAVRLLTSGRAYWNAGIFVWRRDALLDGLREHAPDILTALEGGVTAGDLAPAYAGLRRTSIDHALLEPASLQGRVSCVPLDVGWSDVGSWAALHEELAEGDARNAVRAEPGSDALDIDSRGLLVHAAGGRLVVTVGLSDVVVVDTPDAVLICARDRAQDVKLVVDRLANDGRTERL